MTRTNNRRSVKMEEKNRPHTRTANANWSEIWTSAKIFGYFVRYHFQLWRRGFPFFRVRPSQQKAGNSCSKLLKIANIKCNVSVRRCNGGGKRKKKTSSNSLSLCFFPVRLVCARNSTPQSHQQKPHSFVYVDGDGNGKGIVARLFTIFTPQLARFVCGEIIVI